MSTLYEAVLAEVERYVRITEGGPIAPATKALLVAVEHHEPQYLDDEALIDERGVTAARPLCSTCYDFTFDLNEDDGTVKETAYAVPSPCGDLRAIAAKLGVEAP